MHSFDLQARLGVDFLDVWLPHASEGQQQCRNLAHERARLNGMGVPRCDLGVSIGAGRAEMVANQAYHIESKGQRSLDTAQTQLLDNQLGSLLQTVTENASHT